MQEIHNLAVAADGSIYALGVDHQGGTIQRPASIGVSSVTSLSTEGVVTISTGDDQEEKSPSTSEISAALTPIKARTRTALAMSVLFRVPPDGGSDVYWR